MWPDANTNRDVDTDSNGYPHADRRTHSNFESNGYFYPDSHVYSNSNANCYSHTDCNSDSHLDAEPVIDASTITHAKNSPDPEESTHAAAASITCPRKGNFTRHISQR